MIEPNFVENAAPMLIERLYKLDRIRDLKLPLAELRVQLSNTSALVMLDSETYGQLVLERARELVHMEEN